MKYNVNHFDKSNVFGCQGLQESAPQSRCKMFTWTTIHTLMIPFTLLFYPVYVLFMVMRNPYNMPKEYRCLCFCNNLYDKINNSCISCCFAMFFAPFVLILGLIIGAISCAIFSIPAILLKIYKLLAMGVFWRCSWCLNRHKK